MIRPEGPGFTCDNPGFGSLLFYLGKDLNERKVPGQINEDLSQLEGWTFTNCSYKQVDNLMSFVSSGVNMQKKKDFLSGRKLSVYCCKGTQNSNIRK